MTSPREPQPVIVVDCYFIKFELYVKQINKLFAWYGEVFIALFFVKSTSQLSSTNGPTPIKDDVVRPGSIMALDAVVET